jgi:hypothetical protein
MGNGIITLDEDGTTLEDISDKLDIIIERLDQIEERVANVSTPGTGYSVFDVDE